MGRLTAVEVLSALSKSARSPVADDEELKCLRRCAPEFRWG
jgi:hypothetical protein